MCSGNGQADGSPINEATVSGYLTLNPAPALVVGALNLHVRDLRSVTALSPGAAFPQVRPSVEVSAVAGLSVIFILRNAVFCLPVSQIKQMLGTGPQSGICMLNLPSVFSKALAFRTQVYS